MERYQHLTSKKIKNMKWIFEEGLYYPVTSETSLHATPGMGVFNIESKKADSSILGLKKIADKFEFNFKIYDLGCDDVFNLVESRWNNPIFKKNGGNLGVIFNGLKGTGKTIAAKLLSNKMNLPVLLISEATLGLVDFINSIEFECVVIIDEAEKTFEEEDDMLLRLIESVYNKQRKLFILTTNTLDLNDNLLGRPGRIRYIKQFENLTEKAINEYLDDNLIDQSRRDEVLRVVDILAISTIDILRSIVDEVNMGGDISENCMMNIPKSNIEFEVLKISCSKSQIDEVKDFVKSQLSEDMTAADWLNQSDCDDRRNFSKLRDKYYINTEMLQAPSQTLYDGLTLVGGSVVIESPDSIGFFMLKNKYNDEVNLYLLLHTYDHRSLYKGRLIK